jgi:hypothetical protein
MATYKKCDYVEIITDELAKKGKRLTNLSKASIEILDKVCIKYNIDIDALYPSHIQRKKEYQAMRKIERKEQKEKMEAERLIREEKNKIRNRHRDRLEQHYNNLSQEIKDNCIKAMEEAFQKQYEKELLDYENNYEKRKRAFESHKLLLKGKLWDDSVTLEDVEKNGGTFMLKNGIHLSITGIGGYSFSKPYLKKLDGDYSYMEVQKPVQDYLWSIKAYKYKRVDGGKRIELIV